MLCLRELCRLGAGPQVTQLPVGCTAHHHCLCPARHPGPGPHQVKAGWERFGKLLRELLGPDVMATSVSYGRQDPGSPGISIHTDHQTYGSRIFGLHSSSPAVLRVLYYLDENDMDHAPFRVIPGAHLSFHPDANSYARYQSHPEQRIVCCKAGDAVVLNAKAFHGTMPNLGTHTRRMLAIAYRPTWVRPCPLAPAPASNSPRGQS